jgi:Tfp pilus assembly protein PilF
VAAALLAVALVALLSAWWTHVSRLDVAARRLHRLQGFPPLLRRTSVEMTSGPLTLDESPEDPETSLPARRTLRVPTVTGESPLFTDWDDPAAAEYARVVAERLGRDLRTRHVVAVPAGQRAASALVWVSLASLALVMLVPVLTGKARLALPSFQAGAAENGPPNNHQLGREHYNAGRFSEAEAQLRLATKTSMFKADAWNLLAYTLAQQKRLDEALQAAMTAHRLAPNSSMIADTVAEMHQRRHEFPEAEKWYRRAIKGTGPPYVAETHAKFAQTLLALNRRSEAVEHFRIAARNQQNEYGRMAAHQLAQLGETVPPAYPQPLPSGPSPMSGGLGWL